MNIYRHKLNGKLYTIEHMIVDIKHTNRNVFAGIYAYPYNWKGEEIIYQNQNNDDCNLFVEQNFEAVSHI
jgi:hypothetical protein